MICKVSSNLQLYDLSLHARPAQNNTGEKNINLSGHRWSLIPAFPSHCPFYWTQWKKCEQDSYVGLCRSAPSALLLASCICTKLFLPKLSFSFVFQWSSLAQTKTNYPKLCISVVSGYIFSFVKAQTREHPHIKRCLVLYPGSALTCSSTALPAVFSQLLCVLRAWAASPQTAKSCGYQPIT